MKLWILLSVAAVLLIWSLMREHLENYDEALAEVGQVRAYNPPPICPVGTIMRSEDGKCVSSTSSASPMCATGYELKEDKKCHRTGGTETAEPTCPAGFEYNSSAARCDTRPVEPTCPGGYTYRNRRCESNMTPEGASPTTSTNSTPATTGGSEDTVDPMCPAGTSLVTGFGPPVCETPGVTDFTCPAGYTPTTFGNCKNTANPLQYHPPQCPAGKEFNDLRGGCTAPMTQPTCPSGYQLGRGDKCVRPGTGGGMGSSAGMTSGAAGSTTGGSSTSSWGPNSGGSSNRLRQVFGPQFTSKGDGDSGDGGDSSKTNVYPELLGGRIDTSSRIPGAGIQSPSKNWTLTKDGSLPPTNTTGSDPMSQYFPFSRTPGDMDIIPDPYRVAKTFSSSSYSSKTEPVPFLTDFSAFQR